MSYVSPPSTSLLKECPLFEVLNKKLTLSLLDGDGALKAEVKRSPSIQVLKYSCLVIDGTSRICTMSAHLLYVSHC